MNIKKCLAVLLSIATVAFAVMPVSAYYHSSASDFEQLPEGWTVETTQNSSVEYESDSETGLKNMLFKCDTSSIRDDADVTVSTDWYQVTKNVDILIKTSVDKSVANVYKRVGLEDADGNVQNLFTIVQNTLSVANNSITIENDKVLNIEVGVNRDNNTLFLYIDGVKQFEATIDLDWNDLNKFKLNFYHGYAKKKTISHWRLYAVDVSESGTFQTESFPENGGTNVDSTQYDGISVDFGVIMQEECFNPENIILKENDENIAETSAFKRLGSKVEIIPENGLKEGSAYSLSFTVLKDIFGNEYSGQTIEFKTAQNGYKAPTVRIVSPVNGDSFPLDYDIVVQTEVEEGSAEITTAELIVNNEVSSTKTEAPYNFTFHPYSGETQDIKVRITDSNGGLSKSDEVRLQTFENQEPQVTINIEDGTSVQYGEKIRYSVSDENGISGNIVCYVNDEVVLETEDKDGFFTIPESAMFGNIVVRVECKDIYGKTGSAEKNIYLTKQSSEIIATNDFSKLSQTKFSTGQVNAGPFTLLPVSAPGYAMSGEIDGQNCLICGVDGTSSQTSLVYYAVPTNLTDTLIKLTWNLRIYVESDVMRISLGLRSGGTPASYVYDVKIQNGSLQYADGGRWKTTSISHGWHDISYKINTVTGTYDLMLDNEVVAESYTMSSPIKSFSQFRLEYSNPENSNEIMGVSLFEITRESDSPYFIDGSFSDNGTKLILQAKETIDSSKFMVSGGELYCEGIAQKIGNVTISENNESVIINLARPIFYGCNYQAVVILKDDVTEYRISATVTAPADKNISISNDSFILSNGKITFNADVSASEQSAITVILAAYDKNGIMQSCRWAENPVNDMSEIMSPELDYNEEFIYRAYLRDSWSNRRPINKKVYVHSR